MESGSKEAFPGKKIEFFVAAVVATVGDGGVAVVVTVVVVVATSFFSSFVREGRKLKVLDCHDGWLKGRFTKVTS